MTTDTRTPLTDKHRDPMPIGDYDEYVGRPAFDQLLQSHATLERKAAHFDALREALRGVVRVADRRTDEFDAARKALNAADEAAK